MKLLLAADIFSPESGGPATYVVTLANELVKQGVEVRVVSLNPQSDRSVVSCSMKHVTYNNKFLRYFEYAWLLWREARYCDVVYAMGPVNAGLPALIVSRLRGKKFVVKVVGDYAWEQSVQRYGIEDLVDDFQKKTYGWHVQLLKLIESFVVHHADKVITPCQYLKKLVGGWGAEPEKVEVIYNAISIPSVTPKEKQEGEQWVVSVGRSVPWKGVEVLSEVIKDFPDKVKLKVVASESRQEALSYLAAADVLVLNSGYEGLSHVLLEAISLGVPVLASAVGGNPEIVPPEYLFPYNDAEAIKEKLSHVLAEPRAKSRALGEQFQLDTMINRTKELLQIVCAQ